MNVLWRKRVPWSTAPHQIKERLAGDRGGLRAPAAFGTVFCSKFFL
jgi:hypothetical protein